MEAPDSTVAFTDPRTRTMESWRARLGVLASRGETEGPRVDEARSALSWWRGAAHFDREVERGMMTTASRDSLLDLLAAPPSTAASSATNAEASTAAPSATNAEAAR